MVDEVNSDTTLSWSPWNNAEEHVNKLIFMEIWDILETCSDYKANYKTIQTQKKNIKKKQRKFYQQVKEECTKTYHQPDIRETKQFWSKIWEQKERNRKAEWMNNMGKELQWPKEIPKTNIQLNSLRATLKKVTNWKTLGHDSIHGF